MTDEQIRSALEPHLESGISVEILRGENDKGEASVRLRFVRGRCHTGWVSVDEAALNDEGAHKLMAELLTKRLARKEQLDG